MTGFRGVGIVADKRPISREEAIRLIEDSRRMADLKQKYQSGNISKAELVEIGARLAMRALNPDNFVRTSQKGNI